MRFVPILAVLLLGVAAPALANYPANAIEWRPRDNDLSWTPVWGYDANGDIACPSNDGLACTYTRELTRARNAGTVLSCGEQMRMRQGISGYDTEGHWCRELALRHGNRDGFKWRAPAHGLNLYWRLDPATGNVQCASDGANCFWWTPSLEAAFKSTTVVTCQSEHYGQPGHWCNALSSERRGNGYAWKGHWTLHYRRTPETAVQERFFSYGPAGDIQCPSNDGRNCFWPKTRAEAEAARQPLACGADHQAKHGTTGYDTPGHWCRTIALAEGNAKGFSYQWGLNGLTDGPDLPEVMCASDNGRDCHWHAPLSATFKSAKPLVCGQEHTFLLGTGGYETDGHWCRQFAAPDMRGRYIRIQNTSGLPLQVCRPIPSVGDDRVDQRAEIRCTDLAAGTKGLATAMAVTTLPFFEDDAKGYLYQSVCVESAGITGMFVGPVTGSSAQITVDPDGIQRDANMLDMSGESRTCREAIGNFTYP